MEWTATQAAFALVAIVGAETLALAGRQAGLRSKVGPWRGAALPAIACWLGLTLGALLGLLCYPDYPDSGPPEKVGVLFVTRGLVLGGAALLAIVRRVPLEPLVAGVSERGFVERNQRDVSVALPLLLAVVGLPATYRLTTTPAQRALPWSATEVRDEHRSGLGLGFDVDGTLTARMTATAAGEVAARLGLAPRRTREGALAWDDGRCQVEWEAGRLRAFGARDPGGLSASLVGLLLVGLVGAFGFGCCGALAVDLCAKRRAFALSAGACWLGLGLGVLVGALALEGPPEAVRLLLLLPGVGAGATAALVVIRRDVTHARPGARHAHRRAALWSLGAGTVAAPVALLVVLLAFTERPQRELPWSAREVRDTCSWEPFFPDYSYTLSARLSEADFVAYARRLGLTPRPADWTTPPSAQVWCWEERSERVEAVWLDGRLRLSACHL